MLNEELLTKLDLVRLKKIEVIDYDIFLVLKDNTAIRIETGIEYGEPFIYHIPDFKKIKEKDRF